MPLSTLSSLLPGLDCALSLHSNTCMCMSSHCPLRLAETYLRFRMLQCFLPSSHSDTDVPYFSSAHVSPIPPQENKLWSSFLRASFIPLISPFIFSSQTITQILLHGKILRKKEKHIWTSVFGSNNPGSQFWNVII